MDPPTILPIVRLHIAQNATLRHRSDWFERIVAQISELRGREVGMLALAGCRGTLAAAALLVRRLFFW